MIVREFILTNKNTNVKWNIDGNMFLPDEDIPTDLLDSYVFSWTVNQWEGIIEIKTKYTR